jgi:succinate dehydrogenase / fumarate reductase flavoprotein subunit
VSTVGTWPTGSFGGAQVSRTFYARGQTGQQLLLGAYNSLNAQVNAGTVKVHERTEMLDLIVIDGVCRGIVVRDMVTAEISSHFGDAVLLCTGGYSNVFFLSTSAKGCNVTRPPGAPTSAARLRQPVLHPDPPHRIPQSGDYQSKLTLMSESLRNDGRVWVPKEGRRHRVRPTRFQRMSATITSSGSTPRSATWCRVTWPRGTPRRCATRAAASARPDAASTSTSRDAINRLGEDVIRERYGNLFDMYEKITGDNPYETPMMIYPGAALHHGRPVGGLRT